MSDLSPEDPRWAIYRSNAGKKAMPVYILWSDPDDSAFVYIWFFSKIVKKWAEGVCSPNQLELVW